MEGLEERLEAMELAVASMERSSESTTSGDNHNNTDKLANSIEALVGRLDAITVALHTTRQKTGRYQPWSEEHETLLTHRYVAKEVLLNVMWKALRVVDSFLTGWREVNKLLDTMPTYTVSRTKRFPKYGLYINIQHLDVYYKLHQLKEYAYKASAAANCGGDTSQFKTVVSTLQTLALSNVGTGRIVGMIHDRKTFEEEYKLTWVGEEPDQTEMEEQKNEDEANEDSNGVANRAVLTEHIDSTGVE